MQSAGEAEITLFTCPLWRRMKIHAFSLAFPKGFVLLAWFLFLSSSGIIPHRSPCSVVCHRILLVHF